MPFPRKLLMDGEDVILDLHPHWWFYAKPVAATVAALVAVVALWDVNDVLRLVLVVLLVAMAVWVVVRYLQWRTTNVVVTTDRIIHRVGVLSKRGKEIPLHRVNDISVSQELFERIIGAGDVMIESGGERGQQIFSDIPKPFLVQNVIYTEMERAKTRDAHEAVGARPAASIPEQIEKLDELRQRGLISQAEFDAKKAQLLERM